LTGLGVASALDGTRGGEQKRECDFHEDRTTLTGSRYQKRGNSLIRGSRRFIGSEEVLRVREVADISAITEDPGIAIIDEHAA
jgi:hypothetical protein